MFLANRWFFVWPLLLLLGQGFLGMEETIDVRLGFERIEVGNTGLPALCEAAGFVGAGRFNDPLTGDLAAAKTIHDVKAHRLCSSCGPRPAYEHNGQLL